MVSSKALQSVRQRQNKGVLDGGVLLLFKMLKGGATGKNEKGTCFWAFPTQKSEMFWPLLIARCTNSCVYIGNGFGVGRVRNSTISLAEKVGLRYMFGIYYFP